MACGQDSQDVIGNEGEGLPWRLLTRAKGYRHTGTVSEQHQFLNVNIGLNFEPKHAVILPLIDHTASNQIFQLKQQPSLTVKPYLNGPGAPDRQASFKKAGILRRG